MCLIVVAWKSHPDYPLLVSANRDEYYARPTQVAHFWSDHEQIFAGRDLQEGGSWMGISCNGRFAAVTNIRNPAANREEAKSRGVLVKEFLKQDVTGIDFCESLKPSLYNGFNFLGFDGESLIYQTNGVEQARVLRPGIYGLSNARLNTPWPKTSSAVKKLKNWMRHPAKVKELALLLNDPVIADDEQLPQTGVSLEMERALSAEFIKLPNYGTRCSTGLMVHKTGDAAYCEITHGEEGGMSLQHVENFLNIDGNGLLNNR